MRVAVVGVEGAGALATSFCAGLSEAGHDATVVDAPALVAGSRALILAQRAHLLDIAARAPTDRLARQLARIRPDLVLVVKGRHLTARALERLRAAAACPLVNYYPDHPLWPGYERNPGVDALRQYDEVIVWAPHVRDALAEAGVDRTRVVPFAYDPRVYHPPERQPEKEWDVSLIGQRYPNREEMALALARERLLVAGTGWDSWAAPDTVVVRAGHVDGPEVCRTYWHSRCAVNVLAPGNMPAHNMRTFEIPATGTPMLVTRTPEHEELFGEDGAILVESAAEAAALLRGRLAEPDELAAIGARGCERVQGHTYRDRVEKIIEPWRKDFAS